jgi:branched-chain amino acid transport system permease protein
MSAGTSAIGAIIQTGSEREPDGLSGSSWMRWIRARAASFGPALVIVLVQQVLFPMSSGLFVRGLIIGALTALIALGMALVYRANRIINFAQAHMGYAPALLAFLLMDETGMPYGLAVVNGLVAAVALGAFTERVVIRRFERAPRLLVTIATLGLSQVLAGLAQLLPSLWDRQIVSGRMPAPFESDWIVGGVVFDVNDLLGLVVAPLAVALVALFLQRSDVGIAVRASADSTDRASLLGIPVHRLQTLVWSLAAGLAFVTVFLRSGILGLPADTALALPTIGAGFSLGVLLRSLVALLLGRMTNLVGVTSAAVALGVLEEGIRRNHGDWLVDPVLGLIVVVALVLRRREVGRRTGADDTAWRAGDEARPVPGALWQVHGVQVGLWVGAAVVAVAALVLPWLLPADQTFEASTLLIYALLGLSLVLLSGWGGIVSLGHIAYFAVGAAVTGWAITDLDLDLLPAVLLATLAGAVVAAVVGLPALRLRGLYLAVTSFAFAMATTGYLLDDDRFGWVPTGHVERRPLLGGFGLSGERAVYYLALVVLVLAMLGLRNLHASRFGRALVALRENDRAAEAYAVDGVRVRLATFALSGAIAALAGGLFFHHESGYHASSYGALANLEVFTMVVIGGLTSVIGALLGALYLLGTRWFLPSEWAVAVAGTGVLAVLLLCPGGLATLLYGLRDRLLRQVAARSGITIPGYSRSPSTPPSSSAHPRDPRDGAGAPTVEPSTDDAGELSGAGAVGADAGETAPAAGAGGARIELHPSGSAAIDLRRQVGGKAAPAASAAGAGQGPSGASSEGDPLLAVRGLEAGYGGVPVLFGVDLEVREGEAVALLGTNGAGKSTVLRAVSGLLDPTAGRVVFKGEDVTGAAADAGPGHGHRQPPPAADDRRAVARAGARRDQPAPAVRPRPARRGHHAADGGAVGRPRPGDRRPGHLPRARRGALRRAGGRAAGPSRAAAFGLPGLGGVVGGRPSPPGRGRGAGPRRPPRDRLHTWPVRPPGGKPHRCLQGRGTAGRRR